MLYPNFQKFSSANLLTPVRFHRVNSGKSKQTLCEQHVYTALRAGLIYTALHTSDCRKRLDLDKNKLQLLLGDAYIFSLCSGLLSATGQPALWNTSRVVASSHGAVSLTQDIYQETFPFQMRSWQNHVLLWTALKCRLGTCISEQDAVSENNLVEEQDKTLWLLKEYFKEKKVIKL